MFGRDITWEFVDTTAANLVPAEWTLQPPTMGADGRVADKEGAADEATYAERGSGGNSTAELTNVVGDEGDSDAAIAGSSASASEKAEAVGSVSLADDTIDHCLQEPKPSMVDESVEGSGVPSVDADAIVVLAINNSLVPAAVIGPVERTTDDIEVGSDNTTVDNGNPNIGDNIASADNDEGASAHVKAADDMATEGKTDGSAQQCATRDNAESDGNSLSSNTAASTVGPNGSNSALGCGGVPCAGEGAADVACLKDSTPEPVSEAASATMSNEADSCLGQRLQQLARYRIEHRRALVEFNARIADTRARLTHLAAAAFVQSTGAPSSTQPSEADEANGQQQLDNRPAPPPRPPPLSLVHAECALLMHTLVHSVKARQEPEYNGAPSSCMKSKLLQQRQEHPPAPPFRYTNYMGLNKPPCLCCARFLAAFNRAHGTTWTVASRLPGTSEYSPRPPKLLEWGFAPPLEWRQLQQQRQQNHSEGGSGLAADGRGSTGGSGGGGGGGDDDIDNNGGDGRGLRASMATADKAAAAAAAGEKGGSVTLVAADGDTSAATAAVLKALGYVHGRLAREVRRMLKKKLWHWNRPDQVIADEERKIADEERMEAEEMKRLFDELDDCEFFLPSLTVHAAEEKNGEGEESGAEIGGTDAVEESGRGEQLNTDKGDDEAAVHVKLDPGEER
jgi:hypothetical protein